MPVLRKVAYHCLYTVLIAGSVIILSAQNPVFKEYQVKAVFLFNFTQFVKWPADAFPKTDSPMVIGILGPDPFGAYLDNTVAGENVNGRPLVVHRYSNVQNIKNCHILFVNKSVSDKARIIAALRGRNILTVSDASDFIYQGGMIRFITVDNKIQFQINPEAAKAENLDISVKLLKLSEIVIPDKK